MSAGAASDSTFGMAVEIFEYHPNASVKKKALCPSVPSDSHVRFQL